MTVRDGEGRRAGKKKARATSGRQGRPDGAGRAKGAEAPQPSLNDIVSQVVDALKPEIKAHVENLRADINADLDERLKRVKIPPPAAAGVNVNEILAGLKGGDMDLGKLASMLPAAVPGAGMEGMTPEQRIEMTKAQSQGQLMATLLPELIKVLRPEPNAFMNEVIQRMFLEHLSSAQAATRAQGQMLAKMAGRPDLIKQIDDNYAALTKPVDQHLDRTPVPRAPQENPQ